MTRRGLHFKLVTCADVCLCLCNGYEEMVNVRKNEMSWKMESLKKKHFCNCPAEPHPYLVLLPLDQQCSLESAEVLPPNGTA